MFSKLVDIHFRLFPAKFGSGPHRYRSRTVRRHTSQTAASPL